jgi:hypothetical protein
VGLVEIYSDKAAYLGISYINVVILLELESKIESAKGIYLTLVN